MTSTTAIVALDGSQLSEASLKYLALLKSVGNWRLHLLAVVDPFAEGVEVAGVEALAEREHAALDGYLARVASDLNQRLALPVEVEVRDGHPDQEIVAVADTTEASLVVLTTHGRSGFGRWTAGSVADKVLRTSPCNLLVIGPEAAAKASVEGLRNILAPVDGSPQAESALGVAADWARASGATLHVVRAYQPPSTAYEAPAMPDLLSLIRESAEAYVSQAARGLQGVKIRTGVFLGPPADQLIAYSGQNQIDLVVMASHGRRGLARTILGSVTDRMLHGPAPVLVVRPR